VILPDDIRRELSELFWSLCDGRFRPADIERLERFAARYPEVRAMYARFIVMCGFFQWEQLASPSAKASHDGCRQDGCGVRIGQLQDVDQEFSSPLSSISVPTYPPPSATGGVLSYLLASLIMFLGVLAVCLWTVPGQIEVAVTTTPSLRQNTVPAVSEMLVAKITRTKQCQWAGPAGAATEGEAVRIGRQFVLTAGKMEVGYNNGTTVVVMGPATYEVDSPNSGFLSVGAATATVPDKATAPTARGGGLSADKAASRRVADRERFAIRTPSGGAGSSGGAFRVWCDDAGTMGACCLRGVMAMMDVETGAEVWWMKRGKHHAAPVYGAQENTGQPARPGKDRDRDGSPGA
jgi:hypothetical protein